MLPNLGSHQVPVRRERRGAEDGKLGGGKEGKGERMGEEKGGTEEGWGRGRKGESFTENTGPFLQEGRAAASRVESQEGLMKMANDSTPTSTTQFVRLLWSPQPRHLSHVKQMTSLDSYFGAWLLPGEEPGGLLGWKRSLEGGAGKVGRGGAAGLGEPERPSSFSAGSAGSAAPALNANFP